MNKPVLTITFLSCASLFCGCIVVGVDPVEEVVYDVDNHIDNLDSANRSINGGDVFSSKIVIRNPEIEVNFIDAGDNGNRGCLMTVRAIFEQVEHKANSVEAVKKTYSYDDGKAMSIGLLPGFGRAFYSDAGYGFPDAKTGRVNDGFTGGGAIVAVPLFDALINCAFFGAPTISSLFVAPFDNEVSEIAQMGLIGCDRFETGSGAGRSLAKSESELTYAIYDSSYASFDSSSGQITKQGIAVPIIATIEIPQLFYRKCIRLEPGIVNGTQVSEATVPVPDFMRGASGIVALSFPVESWRYGDELRKFEGMKFNF